MLSYYVHFVQSYAHNSYYSNEDYLIEIVIVDAFVLAKYDRNILKVLNTPKKDNPHEAYFDFGLNMTLEIGPNLVTQRSNYHNPHNVHLIFHSFLLLQKRVLEMIYFGQN